MRGEGSSNPCRIPCAAAHCHKHSVGLVSYPDPLVGMGGALVLVGGASGYETSVGWRVGASVNGTAVPLVMNIIII